MKPAGKLFRVQGALSWRVANSAVEAFVTRDGGHLAPVVFRTTSGRIQPFAVAPWAGEPLAPDTPGVLRSLRGDFFCAPFGGNGRRWRKEQHPPHGESASRRWHFLSLVEGPGRKLTFNAEMLTRVRRGRIVKAIQLRAGETNVYCRHELQGFSGPMCLGHHATLQFPEKEGSGRISVSAFRFGQVCPEPFEAPPTGGYSGLRTAAGFRSLRRVPLETRGFTDLTRYPARKGFEDLVMLSTGPKECLAWTAVAFPEQGYLWFGLKDPRVLASTVLWHSNGGRYYAPWNGRHRAVLGLEEVTSYFHFGLAESIADNPLRKRGIPTFLDLNARRPTVVNYIMGVAAIPRRFDRVRSLRVGPGQITLTSFSGSKVTHAVDVGFLYEPAVDRSPL